jgi:hypothetical protein
VIKPFTFIAFIFIIIQACLVTSCNDEGVNDGTKNVIFGNGVIIYDTINGVAFDRIYILDGCRAGISRSNEFESIVSIDQNILEENLIHSVNIVSSILEISLWTVTKSASPTQFAAQIRCPRFRQITNWSSLCDFTSGFRLDDSLYLTSHQGGYTKGEVFVPSVQLYLNESVVILTGEASKMDIEARQSKLYLKDFRADNVVINSRDYCMIEITCDDTLVVQARNHSKILYWGNPKSVSVDLDSTSTIERL